MAAASATTPGEGRPLLAAARKGDEEAFGRLVEPYRGELHAHAYRMLGSVHDAEDALQDAVLRGGRAGPRSGGRGPLRWGLYTTPPNPSRTPTPRRPRGALP